MPYIAAGTYSFSVAVGDGTQEGHAMCDWVNDVLVIRAESEKKVLGLIDVNGIKVLYGKP